MKGLGFMVDDYEDGINSYRNMTLGSPENRLDYLTIKMTELIIERTKVMIIIILAIIVMKTLVMAIK